MAGIADMLSFGRRSLVLFAAFGCLAVSSAGAAPLPNTPETATLYLFSKATVDEARQLTTGEFGSLVARSGAPADAKVSFDNLVVVQNDGKIAVLSADLPTPGPVKPTGYIFLVNQDQQWKIEALRTLGIPPAMGKLIQDWDKASEAEKAAKLSGRPAGAREAFELLLTAVKLAMRPDRDAIDYFNGNKPAFNTLRDAVRATGLKGRVLAEDLSAGVKRDWANPPSASEAQELATQLTALKLSGGVEAMFDSTAAPPALCGKDCASFFIYGLGSKTFGYMWLGPNTSPPPLSPQGFLMTAALGEGWYMFKTE